MSSAVAMPAAVVNQHAAGPSEEEIAAAKALAAKAEQLKRVGRHFFLDRLGFPKD